MTAAVIKECEPKFIAKRARQLIERLDEDLGVVNIGDWFSEFPVFDASKAPYREQVYADANLLETDITS